MQLTRRETTLTLVAALALGGVVATLALRSSGTETAPSTPASAPTPSSPTPDSAPQKADPQRVEASVNKGLAWLRSRQDQKSGGWVQDIGYKRGTNYEVTTRQRPHVGVTSLALMAFLASGHVPGRGRHGDVVERGTDFILANVREGGFVSVHDTRMYSHAFATLFMAEIYGMTHREDVREKLQLAVDLTVKSQNALGSWRYRPFASDADMSITVCQIMALRAARNVGIRVPKTTIDRATEYVDRSANKRRGAHDFGGFKYKVQGRTRTSFALTAAGIATLNHSGVYDHALISAGISYLKRELGSFNRRFLNHYIYWYGHYYACQVFFLAGDEEPLLWEWYWGHMSRRLLATQQGDGSWKNPTGPGRAYSTAVACIVLAVPNQYLPIFHR